MYNIKSWQCSYVSFMEVRVSGAMKPFWYA